MVSQADIARAWGKTPGYISQCVKRGCPTESLAAADKWRAESASRRAPTDKKSLAQQVASERDHNSSEARAHRKAYYETKEDTKEARDARRKKTTVIPLTTAQTIAFHGHDIILDLIDDLPQRAAVACNPQNPEIAMKALEAECVYILCRAYEAYKLW